MVTHMGEGDESNAVALVIMADGMGGHAAGNVASNMATSTFNKTFSGRYPTENKADALRSSLTASNETIRAAVAETPGLQGMGCTMVTAFVEKGKLWWVSVGDSHLYLLREREITKLNADHSYGGYLKRMQEQGIPVEPDPKLSPNMLMSAMIGDEIAETDLSEEPFKLRPGDRVIVASDGLDTLGDGAIVQYSAWSSTARECVSSLLKAVEDAGQPRQDNTTVIVIDVKERATRDMPVGDLAREAGEEMGRLTARTPEPGTISVAEAAGVERRPERAARPGPEPGRRSKTGLIVAVLVVALGGAGVAYVMLGKKAPVPPVALTPAPKPVSPPPDVVSEPPRARPAVPRPEPAPPPVVSRPEPTPLPKPAPAIPEPAAPQVGDVQPAAGKVFRDAMNGGGRGPEMVALSGGTFEMGGRASSLNRDELPVRPVTATPFAMSRYEITFAEYDRFAKATGRRRPDSAGRDRETHPVVFVSWDDAYQYAKWLSKQTGHKYRLPSEAEWEYAARAGSRGDFWWGSRIGRENAHCFDCESGLHPRRPAKVGFFKANPFGLYDTAGNVSEWVHDCYHPNYEDAPEDSSVWEGGDCSRRVVRGGSFSSASTSLRSGKRDRLVSGKGYDNVGFRLMRDL